ncbi:MAG: DUF1822 family protein [Pegethrix bostrychoides GSE-TBD4-15B]|jgi:hypothetical protein|uniref:DUF1822 family protein n=1 Tax=Pegethrix bostrychoides GSE-TBD4-15B TaxID=2839662 RepID=A0A951PFY4_9CYAN|nr:DUF1822 family protein [Pegethrix bostrychoides GSE-TBD4-15B]
MNQTVELASFTVPLSYEAHAMAQRLSSSRQTYLKALTVYAVEFYLRCLGIATDPSQSDWRDPWMAKFIDVADLWLEPYGKLECCPVLPEAELLEVAADAWADRIGYVAVQLDPSLKSARLLGFTSSPAALPLSELQPLDQFPRYLQRFDLAFDPASNSASDSASNSASDSATNAVSNNRQIIDLRKWLTGIAEAGWQTIEEVLGSSSIQMATVRSPSQSGISVRQAKLIDVGMDLGEQSVVLSLAITLNPDTSMNVLVQIHPAPGNSYLPPNLQLAMLSATGDKLQEVRARTQDSYIQLRHFRGEAGDSFDIQVTIDRASITESFIL